MTDSLRITERVDKMLCFERSVVIGRLNWEHAIALGDGLFDDHFYQAFLTEHVERCLSHDEAPLTENQRHTIKAAILTRKAYLDGSI